MKPAIWQLGRTCGSQQTTPGWVDQAVHVRRGRRGMVIMFVHQYLVSG
jgi:hypothetical protein